MKGRVSAVLALFAFVLVPSVLTAQQVFTPLGDTPARIWDGVHILGINADGSVNVSPVGGTFAVTQSGAWNIGNITGTVSLPTGAATEVTLGTRLAEATFTTRIATLGQKTMAGSMPVVLASDQASIPVVASAGANLNTSALLTTTAHDAAFGTAGTADTQVRTIQGIASMTPVQVQSNSANLATETTLGTRVADATITGRLPAGASPADNESNTNTNLSRVGAFLFNFDGTAWDRWTGQVRLWDGTNTAAVKAASTAPVASDPALVVSLSPNSVTPAVTWPESPGPDWLAMDGTESLRCKAWNFAGCSTSQVGDCEEYQGGLTGVYWRADANGKPVSTGPVPFTRTITLDNDGAAAGPSSGGASWPFSSALSGRGRTFTDADSPGTACTITAISTAEVVTSCAHGFTIGNRITLNLSGTNSTPSANGLHQVQILSTTTYQLMDVDITVAGTTGSHYGSRTLTSATANFVVPVAGNSGDAGKNITCTVGGVICTTADGPCQGPKFPVNTLYQGTIIGVTNTTTVTVLPTLHVDPGGTATCKIEPELTADTDGLVLGKGWFRQLDLNYWGSETITIAGNKAGVEEGQTYYECELNRNPNSPGATYNMHGGYTLFSDYQGTSYHLSWNGAASQPIKRHKTGDVHGWTRQMVFGTTAGTICSPVSPCPAVGTDWVYNVPTNAQQKVTSCRATLTTNGTIADRIVALVVSDGTPVEVAPVAIEVQTASQTVTYTWCHGCPSQFVKQVVGNYQSFLPLPSDLELTEGQQLKTVTSNIQAGDQWSGIVCKIQQWVAEWVFVFLLPGRRLRKRMSDFLRRSC